MKLDIIGSVASGKTTLARNLSETYHVPFYQKDNIVWERTPDGDRKRDDKERDQSHTIEVDNATPIEFSIEELEKIRKRL